MTTLETIFYVVGTISLGAWLLFLVALLWAIYATSRKVERYKTKIQDKLQSKAANVFLTVLPALPAVLAGLRRLFTSKRR